MKSISIFFSLVVFVLTSCSTSQKSADSDTGNNRNFAIVIHGGAGSITPENLSKEKEKEYQTALNEALETGYAILKNGGSASEAVEATIKIMEDSPLFNAGKGAVFNYYGQNELDASIMDGATLKAGAVTGVMRIKNPIGAARMVMDSCKHVLLSGDGAEAFAAEKGLELVDPSYFYTENQYQKLIKLQSQTEDAKIYPTGEKRGTVGAVALDRYGTIAAGTSTGGLINKKYGRIGDSPIIGAGTYANNATCGISCTGTGEYFIRTSAAHEVSDLMLYKNLNLQKSLQNVLDQIEKLGGDGGMIGIDKDGNIAWYFTTQGMFRAYKKSTGDKEIRFYKE